MSIIGRLNAFCRATMAQIQATWTGAAGYAAAKWDRFTKVKPPSLESSENAIPSDQYPRLRSEAWRGYRDNPHSRKIVSSFTSKAVGTGMTPCSGAMKRTPEGDVPATSFRLRAQQLWREQSAGIDFTGIPSQGGETQGGLERMAIIQAMLSGELLFKIRSIDAEEQLKRRLPVPVLVQLIDAGRLAESVGTNALGKGHYFYRGIEFDANMRRYGYWLHDVVPGTQNEISRSTEPKFYRADAIRHVYVKDDIDQFRGASWFAPAIVPASDFGDINYNFKKSTSIASCVVGGYRLSAGKNQFGPNGSHSDDLRDENGNVITRMSPGMLINLGKDGDFKGFAPNINLAGFVEFFQYMLRGIAAALPGIKSSTVTGDYRGSSFSSERSADNDIWPEIEVKQFWFAAIFSQQIYEEVVTQGVAYDYFKGIVTEREFLANQANYLQCQWQGPVARSINPVDDVQAAAMRIKAGISTPQIEAAKLGHRIEDILRAVKGFSEQVEQVGLPQIYSNNVLGFDTKDVLMITGETAAANANGGANVAED